MVSNRAGNFIHPWAAVKSSNADPYLFGLIDPDTKSNLHIKDYLTSACLNGKKEVVREIFFFGIISYAGKYFLMLKIYIIYVYLNQIFKINGGKVRNFGLGTRYLGCF